MALLLVLLACHLFNNLYPTDQKPKLESGEAPVTPNSSVVLSSSTEAGDDEANNSKKSDKQAKGAEEDVGESSKKV